MQISVVIPVYNEEEVIVDTIRKVTAFLRSHYQSWEIIVVDDKSTDGSLKILQNIEDIKVLVNNRNHGKGYGVRKGVLAATGDWILFMDADNSTDITELEKLLPYQDKYSLIIGSRALADSRILIRQNILKSALGKFGNIFIRLVLATNIRDTQCGFKFFHRDLRKIFEKISIERWGFDFELIFLAKKYNFKVKEVGITWSNNFNSSVTGLSYLSTFLQLFKIRFNNSIGKYKI